MAILRCIGRQIAMAYGTVLFSTVCLVVLGRRVSAARNGICGARNHLSS